MALPDMHVSNNQYIAIYVSVITFTNFAFAIVIKNNILQVDPIICKFLRLLIYCHSAQSIFFGLSMKAVVPYQIEYYCTG